MSPIVKKDLIRRAWELTKRHWLVLVGACAIVLVVSGVLDHFTGQVEKESAVLGVALTLVAFAVSAALQLGIAHITLRIADGEEPALEQLFADIERIWPMVAATVIYSVIVIAGIILLIVPGIIWAIRYGQYPYVLITSSKGPLHALSESARITKGHVWQLFLLGLIIILINLVGAALLFVGLLATIPLTLVVGGLVYRVLVPKDEVVHVEPSSKDVPAHDASPKEASIEA